MERRLKNYLSYIKESCTKALTGDELEDLLADLLVQIGFFQHERLIHLIVTAAFAILTVSSIFVSLFCRNAGLYLLTLLFLILLVPYIRHYYILENGVQKLYKYYDELIIMKKELA